LREADRLKNAFLANTSHERRTPLNGIIGIAESLEAEAIGKLTPETRKTLGMIANSGKQLTNLLVNDILDFAKLRNDNLSLNLQPINISSVLNKVLQLTKPLAAPTLTPEKSSFNKREFADIGNNEFSFESLLNEDFKEITILIVGDEVVNRMVLLILFIFIIMQIN